MTYLKLLLDVLYIFIGLLLKIKTNNNKKDKFV